MIYIKRSDGAYVAFEGMSLDQIAAMLTAQGLTYTVITVDVFNAASAKAN